ncbi:MAG: 50S ribosomal protein L24, partial [Actinomycetes bacterium]
MARIRKGDKVQIIAGKDKGVIGTVIQVIVDQNRIIVEGVNRIKKHTKVGEGIRGAQSGGIITTEA